MEISNSTTTSSMYQKYQKLFSKGIALHARRLFFTFWLITFGGLGMALPVHGHSILGITQCNSNSFTIQVTNFSAGTLVAQLVAPGVDMVVSTTYDVGTQTIVAVRPSNLPGGTYLLNLYLNGVWVAGTTVTICSVSGVGTGAGIIGITQCDSNRFTIQVTNLSAGTVAAQLMTPNGNISLSTVFDVGAQTIVALRPSGLPGGTYHLNISLNGALVADANVTLCNVGGTGGGGGGVGIIGITQCNSNSFVIQVTNFPAGSVVAQLLLMPSGEIILNSDFDVSSQTIVAVRPPNLPAGTYHLNLYLNGVWVAQAEIDICSATGGGGGGGEGVTPGGRTLGFWSNKNGQALITSADLQGLRNLCLRTTGGADFSVSSKTALRTWLLGANGRNMASMLSAQLAATYLSVQHGFTDPNVVVDGSLTVSGLITYANSLLCADGMTLAGDPNRAEQARVEGILDRINSGGSFNP
jgi:hypothetical protein